MKISRTSIPAAWTHYWAKNTEQPSHCLPDAPPVVSELLQTIWQQFFLTLPGKTKVLDLGTGNGTVLQTGHDTRTDLTLTGIDYVKSLPTIHDEITMMPGISFEDLPFANNTFGAVTSQFGIEYGDLSSAVTEFSRVTTDHASLLFVCHDTNSIIVEENRKRQTVLRHLLANGGLISTTLKLIRQKKTTRPKGRRRLDHLLNTSLKRFPEHPVILEVADRIAQILVESAPLEKLLALRQDMLMEDQRINALKKAALCANRAQDLTTTISGLKKNVNLEQIFIPGTTTPLAWKIHTQ
ncbi:hypothetical protein DGMP_20800 [Desulfomarina profundi]|uniref:Methyltransferase type 11 domain-containing protein n=1 Tax=Desulfomarina profundi TaxID=2772557 RepID=A0A8D5JMA8_9BACT|nr:class I SAM-dependent methyltransferase [Desulfomarina profundi]BCL61387.1 hypothetical protein DGMP_20800 [Desulfomarina profundi]